MFKKLKNNLMLTMLLLAILLSIVSLSYAATSNPGHPWTDVGDGNFIATGANAPRDYSFPDTDTTILTTSSPVTAGQGGTGTTTLIGVIKANAGLAWTAITNPIGLLVGTRANQILNNKTINLSNNSLVASSTATSTQLLGYNGAGFVTNSTTTPGAFLQTDATGSDLNWATLPTGPAGSDMQIQFNDQGNWGATSSLATDNQGIVGVDNMLTLDTVARPTNGNLKLYARDVDGRKMMQYMSDNAVSSVLQPNLYNNYYSIVRPGGGTTLTSEGAGYTLSGGIAASASEATGLVVSYRITSATGRYIYSNSPSYYRGSVPGRNGFFAFIRVYYPDATYTNMRFFNGMTSLSTSGTCNSNTPAGSRAGFRLFQSLSETNWKFNTMDGSTTNIVDTGMAFTVRKLYDMYIYLPPQGSEIFWRIDNVTDDVSVEGSTTTNLPAVATAMYFVSCEDASTYSGNQNVQIATMYAEVPR